MYGIIPAAGRGNRLRPITHVIPKELLIFGNKALIEHGLGILKEIGISQACIITGDKKAQIIDFIKDGSLYGMEIDFAYQSQMLGPAHAVLCARKKVRNGEDVFVIFGDTILEPASEAKRLIEIHKKEGAFATFFIKEVDNPERWGIASGNEVGEGIYNLDRLVEKPKTESLKNAFKIGDKWLAIVGVYCLNQKIFDYIEKTPALINNEKFLTEAIQAAASAGEKIIGVKFSGKWLDIGTPQTFLLSQWDFFRNKSKEEIMQLARDWELAAEKMNTNSV